MGQEHNTATFSVHQKKPSYSSTLMEQLNKSEVHLLPESIQPQQVQNIKKWGVNSLYINLFFQLPLLSTIVSMELPNLTLLNIANNQISSVETLPWINLQGLQSFNLSGNQLVSIKEIRKLHLPLLRDLFIHKNYICDGGMIGQGRMDRLEFLSLCFFQLEHQKQLHDARWVGKLHANLNKINLMVNFRVKGESSVVRTLQHKYQKISIYR